MDTALKVISIVTLPFVALALWGAVATAWRAMQLRARRRVLSKALFVRSVFWFAFGLAFLESAITRFALEGEFIFFSAAWRLVMVIAMIVSAVWFMQLEYSEAETHFRADFWNIMLFRAPQEESGTRDPDSGSAR